MNHLHQAYNSQVIKDRSIEMITIDRKNKVFEGTFTGGKNQAFNKLITRLK